MCLHSTHALIQNQNASNSIIPRHLRYGTELALKSSN
jgi:hypothetical protein